MSGAIGKKKGQKTQKRKTTKSKNSQRKNSKKSTLPHGGNDLSQKLYSTMEKHKEVRILDTLVGYFVDFRLFLFLCQLCN